MIKRVMNDEREDEMEENLQQVSQIVRIQKLLGQSMWFGVFII